MNDRTVRRYVALGYTSVPYIGRGRKRVMPDSIMKGIDSAVVLHIQLSNAGIQKMPDH